MLFSVVGNTIFSENTILKKAVAALGERLPKGWTVNLGGSELREVNGDLDGVILVTAPDGREGTLIAEVKKRLDPRRALDLAAKVKSRASGRPTLAVAPWISRSTRELLGREGIGFVDLTGSVRVVLSEPGLFIDTAGAEHDPWPEASRVTLRGAKAARVVRALCAGRPPMGVRRLAGEASTTPGYVSKLLGMLDEQAAVRRTETGQVGGVDLRRLLQLWADDAPLESRSATSTWIAPRGLTDLHGKLRTTAVRYAVTGSLAASRRAPVAAPRLVSIYVDDPDVLAPAVGLRPADAGANVLLLVPDDEYPLEGAWADDGMRFAALPQVVADLLSGPGRGPAEAEALLAWMSDNPEVWRG